jgi:hypothetical protein
MADHFVLNERKMEFNANQSSPKDRSIFRKNIVRAILKRDADPYLPLWEIDFTTRASRASRSAERNVAKEREIEAQVTQHLRERFSFRWIAVDGEARRMGREGLEASLIGTLSECDECLPSSGWLGRFSPKPKIAKHGLWLEQHLDAPGLSVDQLRGLAEELFAQRT